MKVIFCVFIGVALTAASAQSNADTPNNVQALAADLATSRDSCSKHAKDASDKFGIAQYKASLDDENAALQAKMDTQVYAVSHGNRESRDFLLNTMQANSEAAIKKNQGLTEKLKSDSKDIEICVSHAQQNGKDEYSSFKADKAHRRDMIEAESVMTAWLTNIAEISTDHPQGSESSLAAWKSAKAHAEVSAL